MAEDISVMSDTFIPIGDPLAWWVAFLFVTHKIPCKNLIINGKADLSMILSSCTG